MNARQKLQDKFFTPSRHQNGTPVGRPPKVPRAEWPKIVARMRAGESAGAIAPDYDTSHKVILKIARSSGYEPPEDPRRKRYTAEQIDEMVEAYRSGMCARDAAAIHGMCYISLLENVRKAGVPVREANDRSYWAAYDETRFAACDTEAEAYWLGFLYTDGCVSKVPNNGSFSYRTQLALQHRDHEHVRKFAQFLGSDREPLVATYSGGKANRPVMRSTFHASSPVLYANLCAQGMHDNKTWTIKPWNGPAHLMRHFWRGCVDGDGGLHIGQRTGRRAAAGVMFCGNEAMTSGFSAFVASHVGSPGCTITRTPEGKVAREAGLLFSAVHWGGYQMCAKILRLLYDGATVALDRKVERASQIIAAAGAAKKRRSDATALKLSRPSFRADKNTWYYYPSAKSSRHSLRVRGRENEAAAKEALAAILSNGSAHGTAQGRV